MTEKILFYFIMVMIISIVVPLIISKLKRNALSKDNGNVLKYPKFMLWFAIFVEIFFVILVIVLVVLTGYHEGDWVYMLMLMILASSLSIPLFCLALFWKVEIKEEGFERSFLGKKQFYRYSEVTRITCNRQLYRIYIGRKCFRLEAIVIGSNKLIDKLASMGVPTEYVLK